MGGLARGKGVTVKAIDSKIFLFCEATQRPLFELLFSNGTLAVNNADVLRFEANFLCSSIMGSDIQLSGEPFGRDFVSDALDAINTEQEDER